MSARRPLALVPLLALLGAGATLSGCSPALTGLAQGVAMSLGQAAGQSGSGSAPAMPADEAALWQAEADRRGLTPQSCPTAC